VDQMGACGMGHERLLAVFIGMPSCGSFPDPGRLTLDIGCGEGRLSRDLRAPGHSVVSLDASQRMAVAARTSDRGADCRRGRRRPYPCPEGRGPTARGGVSWSLQDIDDMAGPLWARRRGLLQPSGTFSWLR